MAKQQTIAELKTFLQINVDDLDSALQEQPQLFYDVAEACTNANAARDGVKLDLDELMAKQDGELRAKVAAGDGKMTEAALAQRLREVPEVKELTRDLLDLKAEAERWLALKEAFQQRSFMLRELVSRQVAAMQHLGITRSADKSRTDLSQEQQRTARADRFRRPESSAR